MWRRWFVAGLLWVEELDCVRGSMITGRFRWSSSRSGAGTVRAAVSGVQKAVAFVVGLQDVAAGSCRSNTLKSLFSSFRNLTHLASLLLLAKAIEAGTGWQIWAAELFSKIAVNTVGLSVQKGVSNPLDVS